MALRVCGYCHTLVLCGGENVNGCSAVGNCISLKCHLFRNICRDKCSCLSMGIGANVCVSAVVPFRSRVLSHETKTLNEDKT